MKESFFEVNFHNYSSSKHNIKFVCIFLVTVLAISILAYVSFSVPSFAKEKVTLRALFVDPKDRWDMLIPMALRGLTAKHPELDIEINYTVLTYNDARDKILNTMANQTSVDLISVDQIWLGEFANRGFLTDLTNHSEDWQSQREQRQ